MMLRRVIIAVLVLLPVLLPAASLGEQKEPEVTEYMIPASMGNLCGQLQMPAGEG